MAESLRDYCERRKGSMESVRQDYEGEWRDIARFAQPARSRFLARAGSQQNKGQTRRIRNNKLLDPHGIEAFRTLTNGLTSGLTSPSRPWFKLRLPQDEMNEQPGVREWLAVVEKAMYGFLSGTNFYGAAKAGYAEMGLFGTEACVMVEHPVHGAVCHALTAGEYWISQSDALVPDSLMRVCPMTARQVVQMLGDKAPRHVRESYDKGDQERQIDIWNLIEPNPAYKPGDPFSKPWRSVYWDHHSDTSKGILLVKGFEEQPFWAPRWDVVGNDTYGVSPGMESLPALRELQVQNKRLNELIDKGVHPEKIVKAGLRLTGEPRRVVSAASFDKDSVLVPDRPEYQWVAAVGERIMAQREQIDGLSFADLFNAITNMRGVQPRNVEEIATRNEEKLTQLGPVIERVANEKLEVVIDRVFGIMLRGGLLPPPPPALEGVKIDVEFVSILAQMQRAVGVGQIERAAGFVGNLMGAFPTAGDKIDVDEMIDDYADRLGVPANVIRSQSKVDELRAQRAQQEQAAQAAEMAPAMKDGAEAARLLSETRSGGQSMLDRVMP